MASPLPTKQKCNNNNNNKKTKPTTTFWCLKTSNTLSGFKNYLANSKCGLYISSRYFAYGKS